MSDAVTRVRRSSVYTLRLLCRARCPGARATPTRSPPRTAVAAQQATTLGKYIVVVIVCIVLQVQRFLLRGLGRLFPGRTRALLPRLQPRPERQLALGILCRSQLQLPLALSLETMP
jgi:hypothetical protein